MDIVDASQYVDNAPLIGKVRIDMKVIDATLQSGRPDPSGVAMDGPILLWSRSPQ